MPPENEALIDDDLRLGSPFYNIFFLFRFSFTFFFYSFTSLAAVPTDKAEEAELKSNNTTLHLAQGSAFMQVYKPTFHQLII